MIIINTWENGPSVFVFDAYISLFFFIFQRLYGDTGFIWRVDRRQQQVVQYIRFYLCSMRGCLFFVCRCHFFFLILFFFCQAKKNLFAWCLFFCFVWFHLAEWLNSWIVVDGWMYYSHRIFFSIVLYQFVCQHQFTKIKTR